MKKINSTIGLPVFLNLVGYCFAGILALELSAFTALYDLLLLALTELFFLAAFITGIRLIILSKKKKQKLDVSMKLFVQGAWGILLFIPWLLYHITLYFLYTG